MKTLLFILGEIMLASLAILAGYIYYVNCGDSVMVGIIVGIIYSLLANWLAAHCMEV